MPTILAPASPPAVEHALVDGAVQWLNRTVQVSGLQLATQVSAYVVETFFAGDFSELSNKDPGKNASFAALCAHPGLQMGQTTLYRLVRIGHQARHLPADLSERLTMSHHRELLKIEHVQHKQHLARLAVDHAWTVQELEDYIRSEQPATEKPRGRKPMPPVVKWLGSVQREAAQGLEPEAFAAHVAQLPASEKARVRAQVRELCEQMQALKKALGKG